MSDLYLPRPERLRLRLRFGLRTFFVLVTLFGVWLGWELNFIRQRAALRRQLQTSGGWAMTREDYDLLPYRLGFDTELPMRIPIWRLWLGDVPMAVIGFGPSATPADRARTKKLFPEAVVSGQ